MDINKIIGVLTVSLFTAVGAYADAVITVIHGIPGLPAPVTVTANGGELGSFDFDQSLGPLPVPAGSYDVKVLLLGNPVAPLSATVQLEDGVNYTAVAHYTEDGNFALTLFENNISKISRHDSRVTIRHTAEAPPVDVQLNRVWIWRGRVFEYPFVKALDLANTDEGGSEQFGSVDFRSGAFNAVLLAAGTSVEAAESPVLRLNRKTAYFIYPIGQLGGDFQLFVQAIDL